MGRKLEAVSPFAEGEAGFPSNTMSLGPWPISVPIGTWIHPIIWPQQIWAENWGVCDPLGERELGPHLYLEISTYTMWPGPRPAFLPVKFRLDACNGLVTVHQRRRQDRQTTV